MKMITENSWLKDLLQVIYPYNCAACGKRLQKQEEIVCLFCIHQLPTTSYHTFIDNPLAKKFWGRVPLENVAAYYYFKKGHKVQHLLHAFKYENQPDIGHRIGQLYGKELAKIPAFVQIDAIIPIPLHSKKLRTRGYNQSALFAHGLGASLQKPCWEDVIKRQVFTETQTRKDGEERWNNVKSVFALDKKEKIREKHVLVVDDVITTGATITSCCLTLKEVQSVKISVVGMACALL